MSYIEEIFERAETPLDAALELGRGLMRGNRPEMRRGYSARSAALVACERAEIEEGTREFEIVVAHLEGFALGMQEDPALTLPAEPYAIS